MLVHSLSTKCLLKLAGPAIIILVPSQVALFAQNVVTSPASSQSIEQPVGTQTIRYVTRIWNWSQQAPDDLRTAGSHTIHLSPCPLGLDTSNNQTAPYRVYVSGTGTPEAVTVTGGSCPAGTASGTITVTTAYGHGSGYTVGSASTGIQEAINDAASLSAQDFTNMQLLPAGSSTNVNYTVYAPVFLRQDRTKLSGYGAHILCNTRSACLVDADPSGGSPGIHGAFNTIEGIEFQPGLNIDGVQIASVAAASGLYTITTASNHPFVTGDYVTLFYSTSAQTQEARVQITVTAANQFQYTIGSSATFASSSGYGWATLENAALEDYGEHVTFRDIKIVGNGTTAFFSWGIVFDNDQSAKIDGLTNEASGALKCSTSNFCGAMVYARGDSGVAPVLEIEHLEASMQCGGNGIRYVPGNGLTVQNSVIQGFVEYGIYYGGGLQPVTVSSTYEESAYCTNYKYPGTLSSQAGILSGSPITVLGDYPIGGIGPSFAAANSGSQQNNYYVVIHSSVAGNMGMYYIGGCVTSGSGNCTVYWPEPNLDGLGTVTYDVLVTTGLNTVPPNGTGNYSPASSTGISGSCSTSGICSYSDPQSGTSSYTMGGQQGIPKFNSWPGAVVLSGGATLTISKCPQNADVVSTIATAPSVFCDVGTLAGNQSQHAPFLAVFHTGNTSIPNPSVGATLKVSGPNGGAASSALKGILNFINFGTLGQSDLVTLADCNPFLTLATGGYRPTWSRCDTALGFDSASSSTQSNAGLFLRAPVSISEYINALPIGSTWLERLTATGKTFNVMVNGTRGFQQNGTAIGVYCGTTTSCANIVKPLTRQVYGTVSLRGGTATVIGFSPTFTSSSSFVCTGTDSTSAAAVKIVNTSASSIAITGTEADTIGYICIGT